jgi:hypothetical protein
MKSLKLILAATIFSLALSISSYAGDIGGPAGPTPPPPATCSNCDTSDEVQTSDATSSTESKNFARSEFAVDLLLAMLSFF